MSLRYQNIEQNIQQTRRLRHDLRHILAAISTMAEASDWEHLRRYIREIQNNTELATPLKFCENNAVNAVLSYYAPQMTREDITYSIQVHTERRITIQGSMHGENALAFTFVNTYSIQPKTDSHGVLFSTKHEGNGIGVESVRSIVHKYNGQMDIKAENNLFHVKILLLTK